jgi:hypothetical protein
MGKSCLLAVVLALNFLSVSAVNASIVLFEWGVNIDGAVSFPSRDGGLRVAVSASAQGHITLKWSIHMENYILRIYRRDECQLDSIAGLVEAVETGEIQPFRTLSELTTILAETPMMMEKNAIEKPCFELA